jgi:RHS repeat-associated protein
MEYRNLLAALASAATLGGFGLGTRPVIAAELCSAAVVEYQIATTNRVKIGFPENTGHVSFPPRYYRQQDTIDHWQHDYYHSIVPTYGIVSDYTAIYAATNTITLAKTNYTGGCPTVTPLATTNFYGIAKWEAAVPCESTSTNPDVWSDPDCWETVTDDIHANDNNVTLDAGASYTNATDRVRILKYARHETNQPSMNVEEVIHQDVVLQSKVLLSLEHTAGELIGDTINDLESRPYVLPYASGLKEAFFTLNPGERCAEAQKFKYRIRFMGQPGYKYELRWSVISMRSYTNGQPETVEIIVPREAEFIGSGSEIIYDAGEEMPPVFDAPHYNSRRFIQKGGMIVRRADNGQVVAACAFDGAEGDGFFFPFDPLPPTEPEPPEPTPPDDDPPPDDDGDDDCDTCNDCGAGGADVSASADGINAQFDLGMAGFDQAAGRLYLSESTVGPQLTSPSALQYSTTRSDVDVVRDGNGKILQVKAPQALADIVVSNALQYSIRFFSSNNVGSKVGGLYQTNGTPYVTYTLLNPNWVGNYGEFRIIETRGSTSLTNRYLYSSLEKSWLLLRANSASSQKYWSYPTNGYTATAKVYQRRNPLLSQILYTSQSVHQDYPWGDEVTSRVISAGTNTWTTTYLYWTNVTDNGYRKLRQAVYPNGAWGTYDYDSSNRLSRTLMSWLNQGLTTDTNLCVVETRGYAQLPAGSGDDVTYSPNHPRTVIRYVLGKEVGRTYYAISNGFERVIHCPTPLAAWNASDNLVTTTKSHTSGVNANLPVSVEQADGTMQFFEYASGAQYKTNTVFSGAPNGTKTAIVAGDKHETVLTTVNQVLFSRVTDFASGLVVNLVTHTNFDALGRAQKTVYQDGTYDWRNYDCCGLESEVDRDGATTEYEYDALRRIVSTTRHGIKQINHYDLWGNVYKRERQGTNGSIILLSTNTYDAAGRLFTTQNALGGVTTSHYFRNATTGELSETNLFADGGSRIELRYRDGKLSKITGTAVFGVQHEYGVEQDGSVWRQYTKETKLDASGTPTAEWTKTYVDGAGRAYKTVFAGTGSPYQQAWYNSKGQLWKQRDPDGVITLTSYDAQGRPYYQAVDVNQNDVINTNGLDRVSFTLSDVVTAYSTTVRRSRTYAHTVDNNGGFSLLAMSEQSVDGLKSWQTVYRDASTAVQSSSVTSYGGGGARTVTATNPDGSYTISLFSYGELQSVNRYASGGASLGSTTYSYDAHGRVSAVTDTRNGTTSMTFNNADQPLTTTSPAPGTGGAAQITTTAYDNLGRATNVVYPDGNKLSQEYFLTGLLKKSFGSRTYPVEYSYDAQGKMKTMKTWQNFAGNTGTNTTTWVYNNERGWMTNKVYSDGNGPRYTFTAGGRLKTRVWARGITTTYKYGFDDAVSGNQHGDLTVTDYSDSTPDVTLVHDRLGRVRTVTDVGSRSYVYNLAGQVTQDGYAVGTFGFGSTNDFAYDTKLRLAGITNVTLGLNHNYTYDTAGRLYTATDRTNNVTYTYHANSSLPATLAFKQNTTLRLNQTKAFDKLNRLTDITSTPQASGALPMAYSYQYNDANQRIQTRLADGSHWLYEYDALGQVISGKRFWADGTPVAGQQFEYGFDDIGNRKTTKAGGDQQGNGLRSASYGANGLNQYTNRTVPGAYDILGAATATSTVTVNGASPYRKGEYFWREITASNGSGPVWQTNTVSVSGGSTVGGNVLVPPATQTFGHDLDGNLTGDLVWNYVWDGENRLIQMSNVTTVASAARRKLDFNYDHQGRRFRKVVSTWNGSAWVAAQTNVFHYHGWNVLGDWVSASNFRHYLWGNDLSGSLQGAGGVGGLIAVRETNQVHFVAYDGNGNVAGLVNAADGAVSANYEYGPFGESVRASGAFAKNNPYRFSTKYQDAETDLLYYGYRYYNPSTGRWINRDPIEEEGGINIGSLVGNSTLNHVDFLGKAGFSLHFRAFIPSTLGAFVQNSPVAGVNWIYEPAIPSHWLFSTDDRHTFSSDIKASSRIHAYTPNKIKKEWIGNMKSKGRLFVAESSGSHRIRVKLQTPAVPVIPLVFTGRPEDHQFKIDPPDIIETVEDVSSSNGV